ncbi:MAG: potassium/proton antiporter [Candidatus Eisenbacteria bacterium]|nr:potassium/proton antiporter [Candidatus Eisenbacteria bacterium]
MVSAPDYLLLLIGVLLLFGILAARLSPMLGVPALALFTLAGMAAGIEGPGRIPFHDAGLARLIGSIALIGILFSSGISTRWESVRKVMKPALALSIVGPIVSVILVAWVVHRLAGVPLATGALLGAVVASTDPVALATVLRSRRSRVDARPLELLRFESAAAAAMAAFVAQALLHWASGVETVWWRIAIGFVSSAAIGIGVGVLIGWATIWVLNHLQPDAEILYTLLTVAAGFLLYGLAAILHGSGFLAVFIGALVIGNADLPDRGPMRRFHEGLPWLSQILLFVLLGLLVTPSAFRAALPIGLVVTGVLLFVARPVATLLSLAGSRLGGRRILFISAAGLKGSAPVALATLPLLHQVPEADWILGVTAVVVIVSAVVHGLTIPWVTSRAVLRPASWKARPEPVDTIDLGPGTMACYKIDERSRAAGHAINELNLPENCLLIMILRSGDKIQPHGATRLEVGDEVYAYSPRELFPVLEIRLLGEREDRTR